MLAVIVGCGRMGGLLANLLSSQGNSVIVIDGDESSFDSLTTDFSGFQIVGDATQVEVLRRAKVEQADVLLVLTGDDNVNLTVAQVGRNWFKVPHTVARVFDPARETIFQQLGIETICPTRLSAATLLDTIKGFGLNKE